MKTSSTIETDQNIYTLVPWKTTLSPQLRFKFFLTGVIYPIFCFLFIGFSQGGPSITPAWQSGNMDDYVAVLLDYPTVLIFAPILFFNVVCLGLWCFRPNLSQNVLIRIGLQSGAVLSLMFAILLIYVVAIMSQLAAIFVGPGLALLVWLASLLIKRTKRFSILHLLTATTVVAIALALIPLAGLRTRDWIMATVGMPLAFAFAAGPTLCCCTYFRTAVAANVIAKKSEVETSKQMLIGGWVTWILSFLATWKFAIDAMMIEYSNLPTDPGGCFVSCAAAHGHPSLVGTPVEEASIPVNLQMQRLKFLEFAFAAACPRLHRIVRKFYNWMGPPLAEVCRANVWFADTTFLLLKPLEWLAVVCQRFSGTKEREIRVIYFRNR